MTFQIINFYTHLEGVSVRFLFSSSEEKKRIINRITHQQSFHPGIGPDLEFKAFSITQ